MGGTRSGQLKAAAAKLGITLPEYMSNLEAGLKRCRRCRNWREREIFGVDRSRSDGLATVCSLCRRTPRQLQLIPRTRAEVERRRYATDEAYRFERRQHAHARRRGVKKLSVFNAELLMEQTDGRCVYCGDPATTFDHIIPVSKGGNTTRGNVAPACISCNSSKKDRDLDQFLLERPNVNDLLIDILVMAEVG